MVTIPVVWLNFNEDAPPRGYWDQGLLEDLFAGKLARPAGWPGFYDAVGTFEIALPGVASGAVVVVPGRQNAQRSARVQAYIDHLDWVILIITGDEENEFPLESITHPNMFKWCMTPNPARNEGIDYLGSGYPPGMREFVAASNVERRLDWFFAGQDTHVRRHECIEELRGLPGGAMLPTEGFTQGLPQKEYWENLLTARVAPCPGGPVSPDSFRLYEALEAGCLPIADSRSGRSVTHTENYWFRIFDEPGFIIIDDWENLSFVMGACLSGWHVQAFRAQEHWLAYKQGLARRLLNQLEAVGAYEPEYKLTDDITVLIPTSPSPLHPSTEMIEVVVESVRSRLPDSPIIIMVDGVRDEQLDRREAYYEYVHRLNQLCSSTWTNVKTNRFDHHCHQGVMTRSTLGHVGTSQILFVEHDAPLVREIPFEDLYRVIDSGEANVIRLHHEASILEPHRYLMLSEGPEDHGGVPLTPTVQWSQRPHLASKEWYGEILNVYFGWDSRTMIEDVLYGVLETHWREDARAGWERFKLYIYSPPGDMKRSEHLDGRGTDPKYSMKFEYDSVDLPRWAPHPGVRD